MRSDVRVRWLLDVVDRASRPMLRQDRQIRRSLDQTSAAYRKQERAATSSGSRQTSAAARAAAAMRREGSAATSLGRDLRSLSNAQARALSAGNRVSVQARRIASGYREQAGAARQLAAAERQRGGAMKGAAGAGAGAAGAAGGALSRGARAAGPIGAVAAPALAVGAFVGFERQMDRVQAVSQATTRQIGALNAQAKQLGADTAFSAKEAADGMYQLSTAGFTANQTMKIIPGTLALASASGTELAAAAEIQSAALRGFGLSAGQAGRVADVLAMTVNKSAVEMADLGEMLPYVASTARQTGTSFEEVSAAAGILGNAGIKGSAAGTALRTSMLRLTDPTKKMKDRFREMGIEASDLAAMPLPEVIGRVATGLKKLPTRGEKVGAISAIFGKEAAPSMLNLMSKGRKGIDQIVRSLKNSDGAAKRSARAMRDNVAGAWDEFTGSLETSAITLTERFGPAMKNALKGGARGINQVTGVLTGATRVKGDTATTKNAKGEVEIREATGTEKAMQRIRDVAGDVGSAVGKVGAQLLDAFKPMEPFLRNVTIPLWEGVGKAILGTIVGVFKIAVPAIKALATVLGFVGKVLKPFRSIIVGIGYVIGLVFGGAILKAVSLVGKLGGVFKVVGGAARILSVPLSAVGKVAGLAVRGLFEIVKLSPRIVGALSGRIAGAFGAVRGAAGKVIGAIRGVAGRAVGAAKGIVTGIARGLAGVAGKIVGPIRSGFSSAVSAIRGFAGRAGSAAGKVVGRVVDAFSGIAGKILTALAAGGAAFGGFVKGLANGVIGLVEDAINSVDKIGPISVPDVNLPRFQQGGLVPALVSPGEAVVTSQGAFTVPGRRVAGDTVYAGLPSGAAVLTSDGQRRWAGGASLADAVATQAPHFRAGGIVPGKYSSTSYGPPWGGIQGTGVTRTGVNLKRSPRLYGIAVDPSMIQLGKKPYVWPNPFGYTGKFSAFDTGGAIKGRRVDFYDWRGRGKQLGWGKRDVQVSSSALKRGGRTADPAGRGREVSPRILGKSWRRAGLLEDALSQGIQAGQAGLTRREIGRANIGRMGARVNPVMRSVIDAMREDVKTSDAAGRRGGDDAGGGTGKKAIVIARMQRFGDAITRKGLGYTYGGWHPAGNTRGQPDCSGLVSNLLLRGSGKFATRGTNYTTDTFKGWGRGGAGKLITVGVRGSTGRSAHTMIKIGRKYYESANSRGKAGRRSGWSGSFPIKRHPPGYRRGGVIGAPRLRGIARGAVGRTSRKLLARVESDPTSLRPNTPGFVGFGLRGGGWIPRYQGGGFTAPGAGRTLTRRVRRYQQVIPYSHDLLDDAIGEAAERKLYALRRALVRTVRRGGSAKVVKRLQGAIDLVDFEIGRRIGALLDGVARRGEQIGRTTSAADRATRRAGVDPSSTAGIGIAGGALTSEITGRRANVRDLRKALARAKRTGSVEQIREIRTQLDQATDDLDDALVRQIELRREAIRAAAQERVDLAQFGADFGEGMLQNLDVQQRLNRTADTAAGMRARAAAITSITVPALRGVGAALQQQLTAAQATGDVAGIRAAILAIQQNATSIGSALADAADLVRDAALKVVADQVDIAAHGQSLASLGLQRLELEQRIGGTFEGGGAQRADYIRNTLIPTLNAELAALEAQRAEAVAQGDEVLARQIAEALAGKQNDILQATLDATEQIADNTDGRKFGGSLGFSYGNDNLTDALIGAGNGV